MLKKLLIVCVLAISLFPTLSPASGRKFDQWASVNVDIAIADIPALKTAKDAEWWARVRVAPIYTEFFLPSRVGKIEPGPYNTQIRDYAGEDLEKIAKDAERLMAALTTLHERLPVWNYNQHRLQLMDMAARARARNTPSSRYEQELLKKFQGR